MKKYFFASVIMLVASLAQSANADCYGKNHIDMKLADWDYKVDLTTGKFTGKHPGGGRVNGSIEYICANNKIAWRTWDQSNDDRCYGFGTLVDGTKVSGRARCHQYEHQFDGELMKK